MRDVAKMEHLAKKMKTAADKAEIAKPGTLRAGRAAAVPAPLRLVVTLIAAVVMSLSPMQPAAAQKFYPDDPIWKEPPPRDTVEPQRRTLSGLLEYFTNQFTSPGERQPETGVIVAGNANTLGEVPDSPWFTNRHGHQRMSVEELIGGAGSDDPPRTDAPWQVLTVKQHGGRPGILFADSDETLYLLRFDPKGYPELATGAQLVSSKIYHAAGYNVPQNYVVYFQREDLAIAPGAESITSQGELRDLIANDIDSFLAFVEPPSERGYRAVATRVPYTEVLGPYQFYATRSDDPNDIVPHEHRRDLRGMWVLHAWLGFDDFNPTNTLDVLARDGNKRYVEHYLVDFFRTLGSSEFGPKSTREGNEYRFNLSSALKNIAGMGVWTPEWMRASYPGLASVGTFESEKFDPETWVPDTHWVTWVNRLPDDIYWATKIVMSFTDDDIRALASTGRYSDPRALEWIANALIERRDKIGRAFLPKVLPLDDFRVEGDRLAFDDLMVRYGFAEPHYVNGQWYEFDNDTGALTLVTEDEPDSDATWVALPQLAAAADDGTYLSVGLWRDDRDMGVMVYIRKEEGGFKVVGIERNWPGKAVVEPAEVEAPTVSRYESLDEDVRRLLEDPTRAYNEITGRNLSAQEWFDQLTLSERTTFDAVTNALKGSELTAPDGDSLGTAFDRIESLERIAGQYAGRGGDQQFRLYVNIKPDTREVLELSTQFFKDHENTVYHVGYPDSYRQEGDVPNVQFSLSEDGQRADIDVDYRSSKSPQALFNGHLTSSNSDVRAGDNYDKHTGRWLGLVNWWQDLFGNIGPRRDTASDLIARTVKEFPTPVPPDRPVGAEPEELWDAAQEFFTDWLVRHKVDEAMHFFSRRVIACINIDDDSQDEILDVNTAIVEMREIMEYALGQLGDRDSMTEAIDAVATETEDQASRLVSHPYEGDFTIIQVRNSTAADYMCSTRRSGEPPPMPGGPDATGTYYGVLFRFKARADQGGVLGLLWDRQEGEWKIVSYAVLQQ
jgi:hypothetical protein